MPFLATLRNLSKVLINAVPGQAGFSTNISDFRTYQAQLSACGIKACSLMLRAYRGARMDAISRTQTEVKMAYRGFVVAWFCFIFMLYKMNLPVRNVSVPVFAALCILSASAIFLGFAMRRRFFKLTTEALPHDPSKASQFWRGANFISLCCAINPTIYAVVLKMLGSGWLVPGILFGVSLGFLLLWRPRQLAVSGVQPA